MKNKQHLLFLGVIGAACLFLPRNAFCEKFKLTTGAEIEGQLAEKAVDYIKIKVKGKGNIMTVKMKYLDRDTVSRIREMKADTEVVDMEETLKLRDFNKYIELGNAFLQEDNIEQALTYFDRALELYPEDFDLNFLVARVHLSQKAYDKAIVFLEQALNARPEDQTVLLSLAAVYRINGQSDKALETYTRSYELTPDDFTTCFELGQTHAMLGDPDASIEYLQKAHALEPGEPQVLLTLGNLYRIKENYQSAREHYRKAVDATQELMKDPENKAARDFNKENQWLLYWGVDHIEYIDRHDQLLNKFWKRLSFEEEEFRYATTMDKKNMSQETIDLIAELKQSFIALNAQEEFLPFQEQVFAVFDTACKCREFRIADQEARDNVSCLVEMYSAYLEALEMLTVVYRKHRLPSSYAKQMRTWKQFIKANIKQLKSIKQDVL